MMGQPCHEEAVQAAINNELPPLLDYIETLMPDHCYIIGESLSIAEILSSLALLKRNTVTTKSMALRIPKRESIWIALLAPHY